MEIVLKKIDQLLSVCNKQNKYSVKINEVHFKQSFKRFKFS